MPQAFHEFPLMVVVTMCIVLVLVGAAFRSIIVPIRAVFTISLTLVWVYGFADMTYEHGVMNWTGIEGLYSTAALFWLTPLMVFAIIVGIGLDYDIFLLVRIHEYWTQGLSIKESILRGELALYCCVQWRATIQIYDSTLFVFLSHSPSPIKLNYIGLSKTGHIITAAGLIMAIAFSGLLFSAQVSLLNLMLLARVQQDIHRSCRARS